MEKYDIYEGDNFRVIGLLEPHHKYKGVFVYAGSNLRKRSFAQILMDISPRELLNQNRF